ncbi:MULTISPECIES: hypothetical protein [Pseudidiomarina]|uniref:Uncharacterized protein n=2 Tax=Pseudidiomarina TaxID=2800384 RepID=A0A368V439_9GAMM|nr:MULTISPECIES: hypothetical protein [Pseudidiomarina]PWW15141.1 hypothetical protein DET45_102145 [Pseudidiomarina maritima]RBP91685.1 hypothetical protein DFO81_104145 [Pseudidiomarina tainanensis]RCW35115.1 hypothetical protein DFO79_102146 [Pseudidiomarina tainanensis]
MRLKRTDYERSTWELLVFSRYLGMLDAYYMKRIKSLPVCSENLTEYYQLHFTWSHKGIACCVKGFRRLPTLGDRVFAFMDNYTHRLREYFGDDAVNDQVF